MGRRDTQVSFFDTDYVCGKLIKKNSFYYKFHQHRDKFIRDDDFTQLYCLNNGRPSVPPSIISSTLLLQYHDDVSDREAAERVVFDIRWKFALGVPVDYEGFNYSRLSYFRARLLIHEEDRILFDKFLHLAKDAGILKDNVSQVMDSSHVTGAAAVQDTFTLIREQMRKLLKTVGKKSKWLDRELKNQLTCELEKKAAIDWKNKKAREKHLTNLVTDARTLLEGIKLSGYGNDEEIRQKAELLCEILDQDIISDENGNSKIKQGVAKNRIISTTDPEMRHGRKSSSVKFDGCKAHFSEDPESELVTNVEVTAGNVHDSEPSLELLTGQKETIGLEPREGIGDCAYGTGDNRARFKEAGIEIVAKVPSLLNKGYFPKEDFIIDLAKDRVTCPGGKTSRKYYLQKDSKGRRVKCFRFPRKQCSICPLAAQCTRNPVGGRSITLNYHEDLLQTARARQKDEDFQAKIGLRPGIERKISEIMNTGLRQARYIGLKKLHLQALWTTAGVNLKRIFKLLDEQAAKTLAGVQSELDGICAFPEVQMEPFLVPG